MMELIQKIIDFLRGKKSKEDKEVVDNLSKLQKNIKKTRGLSELNENKKVNENKKKFSNEEKEKKTIITSSQMTAEEISQELKEGYYDKLDAVRNQIKGDKEIMSIGMLGGGIVKNNQVANAKTASFLQKRAEKVIGKDLMKLISSSKKNEEKKENLQSKAKGRN